MLHASVGSKRIDTDATCTMQTLLFECVAEMRAALDRLERVAATETTDAAESRVRLIGCPVVTGDWCVRVRVT